MKFSANVNVIQFCCMLSAAITAQATETAPPVIKKGTTFEMHSTDGYTGAETNHWTLTFNGMKEGNYDFSGINTKRQYSYQRTKDFNNFSKDKVTGAITEYQVLKWPLTVGEEHTYEAAGDNVHVKVEGVEKITVEAGTFNTYRIVLTGTWHNHIDNYASGPWQETDWYAPSVGFMIKTERSDSTTKGKRFNWTKSELISFNPDAVQ